MDSWTNNQMRTILDTYETRNIFNADETGMFLKCLQRRPWRFKGRLVAWWKKVEGPTYTASCCVHGWTWTEAKNSCSKLWESPRIPDALSRPKFSQAITMAIQITGDLFSAWVKKWGRKFHTKKRKALIMDNCRAHPDVPDLKAIKMFYLPPNTTSKLQPMDQGIIQVLKVYYRNMLMYYSNTCSMMKRRQGTPLPF